ncbi:MAG: NAAT family transporter [Methanotrichaceae archaeon]|nr:NAAT family transporter [Methanotrichaceae archaeon]
MYFVYAFASIFVIVNPIEATMVFISLTSGMEQGAKKKIYWRATVVAFAIALLFAVAGDIVLQFFGITVDSLRVAGGILLFLVAIDMLRGVRQQKKITEAELRDANLREDISVFPLATPLLTGPGAITTVVVLMGAAVTIPEKAMVLLALSLTFIATYFILKFSEYIDQALGITGIMVMTRILGLILGAIAVNFVAQGTWNLYQAMLGS